MRRKENWLFAFAALGALGNLTRILDYFGIRPDFSGASKVPLIAPPPCAPGNLVWDIIFFLFSLGCSGFGFYLVSQRAKAQAALDRINAETHTGLRSQISEAQLATERCENEKSALTVYANETVADLEKRRRQAMEELVLQQKNYEELLTKASARLNELDSIQRQQRLELVDCRSRLGHYVQVDRDRESQKKSDDDALAVAPQVTVEYVIHSGEFGQFLELDNSSNFDATYLSFSEITWTERRTIHIPGLPHEVKAHHKIEVQIAGALSATADHALWLASVIEDDVPPNAKAMVTLAYADSKGEKHYKRDFTLKMQSGHRLVWQPNRVRLPHQPVDPRA